MTGWLVADGDAARPARRRGERGIVRGVPPPDVLATVSLTRRSFFATPDRDCGRASDPSP